MLEKRQTKKSGKLDKTSNWATARLAFCQQLLRQIIKALRIRGAAHGTRGADYVVAEDGDTITVWDGPAFFYPCGKPVGCKPNPYFANAVLSKTYTLETMVGGRSTARPPPPRRVPARRAPRAARRPMRRARRRTRPGAPAAGPRSTTRPVDA